MDRSAHRGASGFSGLGAIPNKTRKADVFLRAVTHQRAGVRCCTPHSPRQATTTGHDRRLGGPEDDQAVAVNKQPGKRFGQARNLSYLMCAWSGAVKFVEMSWAGVQAS